MRTSTLRIVVTQEGVESFVDFSVDGSPLDRTGDRERATAREVLGSGALVPTDPPRRIAFYGCGCGIWGCSQISALVERDGWLVRWRDFASVNGLDGVLPDEDDPDPAQGEEFVHWLDLPDLAFAADEYDAVVAEATRRGGLG